MKIRAVELVLLDQRIEIGEEVHVLTELRQIDGDQIIARIVVLGVQQHLLVQDVERPNVELDGPPGHCLEIPVDLLHDLKYGVANSKDPNRLAVQYTLGLRRHRGAQRQACRTQHDRETSNSALHRSMNHVFPPSIGFSKVPGGNDRRAACLVPPDAESIVRYMVA